MPISESKRGVSKEPDELFSRTLFSLPLEGDVYGKYGMSSRGLIVNLGKEKPSSTGKKSIRERGTENYILFKQMKGIGLVLIKL